MSKTLLQKAKEIKHSRKYAFSITKEHTAVALAWVHDEISFTQFVKALDINMGSAGYITLARILKEYIKSR